MAKVNAHIGTELYRVTIKSPSGNTVIADEPTGNGGQDKGFSPHELLAAALAACTSATLRMYADRKEWDLKEVKTAINLEWDSDKNQTFIKRNLEFTGNLDETQRKRLLAIANACPVHKILSHPIDILTTMKD